MECTGEGKEDEEVSRSFSGWLSGIITGGTFPPSLLAGILPAPLSLLSSRALSLSLAFSFRPYRAPRCLSSYFVSWHCPFQSLWDCGGQHGEISDQFFKPRVPRLYTP